MDMYNVSQFCFVIVSYVILMTIKAVNVRRKKCDLLGFVCNIGTPITPRLAVFQDVNVDPSE
jgi:hypothetical protein